MTIHTLTVNGLSAWMKCRIGKCGNKSISFDVHRSVVTGEPFYEILNKYGISFFMDYASRDHGLGIMQTDKNTLQLKTIVQELAAHSENLKGSGFIPQDDYIAMGDRAIEKQKDKILKFLDGKD